MKKETPILFSTPMVQALLAGRKTKTRRVIKMDDLLESPDRFESAGDSREWEVPRPAIKYDDRIWFAWQPKKSNARTWIERCTYKPGDLLWVREKWKGIKQDFGEDRYEYKATEKIDIDTKWKPSIHMPKEAARIWNEITGIRVERIADISNEDCIAEGIHLQETGFYCWEPDLGLQFSADSAKGAFRNLWRLINGQPKPVQKKINGKIVTVAYEVYPFNKDDGKEFIGLTEWKGKPLTVCINPWVWVVEFKVLSTTGKP